MARVSIKINGLNGYVNTLIRLNGNVNQAIERALTETHDFITNQIKEALSKGLTLKGGGKTKPINMYSGKRKNEMADSFYDEPIVNWYGDRAVIQVGFDQSKSMHATYMMITGTPYITGRPNNKLYKAIYGAATKKKIAEIQNNALQEAIEEAMR